jgi:hypothetical protein
MLPMCSGAGGAEVDLGEVRGARGQVYVSYLIKKTKRVKTVILSSKLRSANLSSYKMFQIRLSEELPIQLFK